MAGRCAHVLLAMSLGAPCAADVPGSPAENYDSVAALLVALADASPATQRGLEQGRGDVAEQPSLPAGGTRPVELSDAGAKPEAPTTAAAPASPTGATTASSAASSTTEAADNIVEACTVGGSCPGGYRPMSKEECIAGATYGNSTYAYVFGDGCYDDWPDEGCFRKSTAELYYSSCQHSPSKGRTTPLHFGLCVQQATDPAMTSKASSTDPKTADDSASSAGARCPDPPTTREASTTTATATSTPTATTTTTTATSTGTSTSTGTTTRTATSSTATRTATSTSTETLTSTLTSTATTTSTLTSTSTQTETTTTTGSTTTTTSVTVTSTVTSTTSTTMSSTTTTPYCFEHDVSWGPIDMLGTMSSKEVDEFACQHKCISTPGCSHFSFWKPSGHCHLQDRYAQRQEARAGFVSGPFQCWSYLVPGEYTKAWNHTYLPVKFRCMQLGVTWSPDMAASTLLEGARDEVVFSCQQKCRDTEGCMHFTVMFPGLCRLADQDAVPLPAEQAISGPPAAECDRSSSEAPLGHTLMRKYSQPSGWPRLGSPSQVLIFGSLALTSAGAFAAALLWRRGRRTYQPRFGHREMTPMLVDLEESISQYELE